MQNVIQCFKEKKQEFTIKIQEQAQSYIYREKRYKVPFAISLFYCNEDINIDAEKFESSMRKTDKLLVLNKHIWCVYLDNIPSKHHVKASENLCIKLLNLNNNKKVYAATINSEEFPDAYIQMSNTLFERVKYGLHSKSDDIVICQDYII